MSYPVFGISRNHPQIKTRAKNGTQVDKLACLGSSLGSMTMWAQAEILVQIKENKCLKSGMETLSAYNFKQFKPL